MSRREYDTNSKSTDIILTYTSNFTIPAYGIQNAYLSKGYKFVSFFIVGGGGAGTGDFTGSDTNGFGGCGGECLLISNLPLVATYLSGYIGAGGTGGTRTLDGNNGGDSYVTYNSNTYTAAGGWGGKQVFSKRTRFETYPRGIRKLGGRGGWWGGASVSDHQTRIAQYYNMTPEEAIAASTSTDIWYTIKGETGVKNPFDSTDTTVYGCGGGAGFDAYRGVDFSSTYPNYGGNNNVGGGRGGYGSNNASTNKGSDATSYGSGGGGAAFSSSHTNSLGGSGKAGCIIVCFSK